jgi:hypothetical protein
MANEYWFYFELYAQGRMVGRSRTFEIAGKTTRQDAKLAAEEEWLASGALHGDSFVLFEGAEDAVVDRYTLRAHEDSPTKD